MLRDEEGTESPPSLHLGRLYDRRREGQERAERHREPGVPLHRGGGVEGLVSESHVRMCVCIHADHVVW